MKTKSNVSTIVFKCISILLLLIIACCLFLSNIGSKPSDTYTVFADDEYYSETTYYLKESTYKSSILEKTKDSRSSETVSLTSVSTTNQSEKEFVIAASKRVWVSETTDENGVTKDSHLMTKAEIESSQKGESTEIAMTAMDLIGKNNDWKGYLDVNIVVYYRNDIGDYQIEGSASWDDKFVWLQTGDSAEEFHDDFMGITWGGNGYLESTSNKIEGRYYNGKAVAFSHADSDSYAGYVWQFREKTGWMGKEMKSANATVNIRNYTVFQGKRTSAKLTYIHTWGALSGSVSISSGGDGTIAPSVIWSIIEKSWEIKIDVPGIEY